MKKQSRSQPEGRPAVRCAIYTRKSTEEGLDQDFNSLDAQREAAEAFIRSQVHEGWELVPDRYDDGGFTGGNMERPALQRLLADVESGKINCVVVYKVDRLSRSLVDFTRIVDQLDRRKATFVAVTQQFNTTTSVGRLTLNMLLSFAQFEREQISERTRDKMSAARRKGKWTGGMVVLGYDVDPKGGRLVENVEEAKTVRSLFDLFLKLPALRHVAEEANRRGRRTKEWITRDGRLRRGGPITKGNLYHLLTNPIYVGLVRHKGALYSGEHPAIVDRLVFERVGQKLLANGQAGGRELRLKHQALLRGLLFCQCCGTAMQYTFTAAGQRRYRYYVCARQASSGRARCVSTSIAAGNLEQAIVDRIRSVGRDPQILAGTVLAANGQTEDRLSQLKQEQQTAARELAALNRDLVRVAGQTSNGARVDRLAQLQDEIRVVEEKAASRTIEVAALAKNIVSEEELQQALSDFDPVWQALNTAEQARLLALIVERIGYDGPSGRVTITFRSLGLRRLCETWSNTHERIDS